ncbi:Uncharacterized protein DAT39_021848, partial [Clarias magur]
SQPCTSPTSCFFITQRLSGTVLRLGSLISMCGNLHCTHSQLDIDNGMISSAPSASTNQFILTFVIQLKVRDENFN